MTQTFYTDDGDVARRRHCSSCGYKYWTLASPEEPLLNRNWRVKYPAKGTQREKNKMVRIEKLGTWQS